MIFSKTVGYALQTVIYLNNRTQINPVLQKDITKALGVPHHYLGKILQQLTSSKIVGSRTGRFGGFYLIKRSKDITLCDIIKIFEGENYFDDCILGFPGCDDKTPCPVHNDWKPAKQMLKNLMMENTVADWGESINTKLDYIKSLIENK